EVEVAAGRLGGVPLHLVLGRDHVELAVEDRGVGRVAELAGGHRGAEVAAGRGGLRAQRAGGLGEAGHQQRRARDRECRGTGGQRQRQAPTGTVGWGHDAPYATVHGAPLRVNAAGAALLPVWLAWNPMVVE